MTTRVRRALRPSGGLNALTPLEIASRPVSDDPPLANDFSSTNTAIADRMLWPVPIGTPPATDVA